MGQASINTLDDMSTVAKSGRVFTDQQPPEETRSCHQRWVSIDYFAPFRLFSFLQVRIAGHINTKRWKYDDGKLDHRSSHNRQPCPLPPPHCLRAC